MKIKVSDYIASFLAENGIKYLFTVVGGGAMHLNDSFGHNKDLKCVYCHHEQACAIAAEGYFRVNNEMAAVCVTTGPGGTNAITGVVGAWLDSIPMIVISGQVRFETTARSTGLDIRAMGDQEFDITKSVSCMTKYSEMITDKNKIRYCLEKAFYLAVSGRPGPVWLDVPLDIQGAFVETDDLVGFTAPVISQKNNDALYQQIFDKINTSSRPVINAGSAIRTSSAKKSFSKLVEMLSIPVVTGWNSIDLIEDENPLYVGRAGMMGDRAGNFAVQNSDLVLSLASRLSIRQVGYNFKSWAREAFVISVDIDKNELKKPTLHVELPVCMDVKEFIEGFTHYIVGKDVKKNHDWLERCQKWKNRYPAVRPDFYESEQINVYAFIKSVGDALSENQITVVGNGSACVVGSQAFPIKKESRFLINSAIASMGYDLPATVGACFANNKEQIVCITGDGSIQMNLQELQTIVHHKLPVKIFVINNGGYHSIRQTQNKFFNDGPVGIGVDSGDLSFPSLKRIAYAYDIPYFCAQRTDELENTIKKSLTCKGYSLTEIVVDFNQAFEPKAASKINENGQMYSAPLEDLFPFLSKEELKENMIIPLWNE